MDAKTKRILIVIGVIALAYWALFVKKNSDSKDGVDHYVNEFTVDTATTTDRGNGINVNDNDSTVITDRTPIREHR